MRAFLLSCATSSPLIVLYHILTRFRWTTVPLILLYFGIAVFAGAMYGLFAHQRGEDPTIPRLLIGAVVSGIVVATVQTSVAYGLWGFDIIAPFLGGMLGGVGAGLYLAMQRAGHGKEDAAREERFRHAIEQRDMGSSSEGDNSVND